MVDPGRVWKGPWRWYDEKQLSCCKPLELVQREGVTLPELACLARCEGARVTVRRPAEAGASFENFECEVRRTVTEGAAELIVASYSRKALGQTGDGHFAVLGAYDAESESVLMLETARFKYPLHWLPLRDLYESMGWEDQATGQSRGWMVLSADEAAAGEATRAPLTLNLRPGHGDPLAPTRALVALLDELMAEAGNTEWAEWAGRQWMPIAEYGMVGELIDEEAQPAEGSEDSNEACTPVLERGLPECGCDSSHYPSFAFNAGITGCSTRAALARMPGAAALWAAAPQGSEAASLEDVVALLLAAVRVASSLDTGSRGRGSPLRLWQKVQQGLGDARQEARVERAVRHLATQLKEVYRAKASELRRSDAAGAQTQR